MPLSSDHAEKSRSIRVGGLAPLSRPGLLEAGRHLRAGLELAVEDVNEGGGVDGQWMELLLHDTAGSPERGAGAVRELEDAGAVAVAGEYHSVVASAAAAQAHELRLPFVCSSAVLDALTDTPTDVVARIAPAQSHCWQIYGDYLLQAGLDHIALIIQPDRYWSSGTSVLQTHLGDRGGTVTMLDANQHSATLLADQLAAIDGIAAALLLVAYPEPAATIARAIRAHDRLSGLLIGDPAGRVEFPEWLNLVGEPGLGVLFLRYMPPTLSRAGSVVMSRLARRLGESPSFVALEAYDAIQVIAAGLRLNGPLRESLRDSIQHVEIEGTRGSISFSRTAGVSVLQWAWPPVQVAARLDMSSPVTVLHQWLQSSDQPL